MTITSAPTNSSAAHPSAVVTESHERYVDVLIVGTGLGGLGTAIALLRNSMTDFVLLEKADAIGGTWRDNTYPGCACDVASAMYSYSFAPNPSWSKMYAEQPEILAYINDVAAHYNLARHIHFNTEALGYEFDEALDRWRVSTDSGTRYLARIVVAAHGALHKPNIPNLAGAELFSGPVFHTADWDHSVPLAGKTVAVIGTGASAAQLVPRIAEHASQVNVYQRTAHWVLPKAERPIGQRERTLLKRIPLAQKIYRNVAYWTHEVPVLAFMKPRYVGLLKLAALRHLKKQVPDPELRAALTPRYTIGCKRILLSNDFYPALQKPNVRLVAEGVDELFSDGVKTTSGIEYHADVIVYATGFDTENRCATESITGRDGVTIQQAWREGMQAYLGVAVTGFPNLFMLMGPNSGGGSQSILFVIECQIRYILGCLEMMKARNATRVEVRPEAQQEFNQWLHAKLAGSVWNSGGCHSWFLDHTGANRQSWPGTGTSYWRRTRQPDPAAFELTAQAPRDVATPVSRG
ncbi:flavin-containing monooxygenase [Mycobacteroides abscessus]|uniref:flavin-containing monooxygenase n=1 Tax=Mycobacteroides abscessus TaxID=36809 RepID=UPI0009A625E2|nr:NAD(P)/FAD-dependent oxidoreductase [Mycobacteroides abscessus]RIT42426.1 NAD(P)/FAD-dependent oxidoreductase [Mycobacteroides abscessus]SKT99772.1 cyclohexanone monooxygenase [Mycobacteroides abscessus subsp. massiliense]SKU19260.1 cyclohexanone monooxygenase [Mycobacteroides abscessus subsp. massiliense]